MTVPAFATSFGAEPIPRYRGFKIGCPSPGYLIWIEADAGDGGRDRDLAGVYQGQEPMGP